MQAHKPASSLYASSRKFPFTKKIKTANKITFFAASLKLFEKKKIKGACQALYRLLHYSCFTAVSCAENMPVNTSMNIRFQFAFQVCFFFFGDILIPASISDVHLFCPCCLVSCWMTCHVFPVCWKWDPHPVAGAWTVSKRAPRPSLTLSANCSALPYLLGRRTQVNCPIAANPLMKNGTNFPLRLLTPGTSSTSWL